MILMADNILVPLMLVLCIQAILIGANFVVGEVRVAEGLSNDVAWYSDSGSVLCRVGDCLNNASAYSPKSDLPIGVSGTDISGGSFGFIDGWNTLSRWVSGGAHFLMGLLTAPFDIARLVGLPVLFAFLLTTVWYGYVLILLIIFIRGS